MDLTGRADKAWISRHQLGGDVWTEIAWTDADGGVQVLRLHGVAHLTPAVTASGEASVAARDMRQQVAA